MSATHDNVHRDRHDAPDEVPICVIGASAGGLTALEAMVGGLSNTAGVAYVVVQHLSPDHESVMSQLLSAVTDLPVAEIADGDLITADRLHLIAPGTDLRIDGDFFRVTSRTEPTAYGVINDVFRSVSTARGSRCAAVVLSGSGSDGASALAEVRSSGGLTLAQDGSAHFDDMPRAAVATGAVDAEFAPGELADAVNKFFFDGERPAKDSDSSGLSLDELRVVSLLSGHAGVDFSDYKHGHVKRIVAAEVTRHGLGDVESYVDALSRSEVLREALAQSLLIGVTGFFRDPGAFAILEAELAPQIVARARDEDRAVRAWVAGCATGEEAYSVAMALLEAAEQIDDAPPIRVYATDIDDLALSVAEEGVYGSDVVRGVNPERRSRWFVESGSDWRANSVLRSVVTFTRHDLLADAPFTAMDLVSCRNVLIYLRTDAQERASASLGFALRQHGFLMLGESEAIGAAASSAFDVLDETWGFLVRVRPVPSRAAPQLLARAVPRPNRTSRVSDRHLMSAYDALLRERFASAVVVDEQQEVVHLAGDTSTWLRPVGGRASLRLVDMVPDGGRRAALMAVMRDLQSGSATSPARPFADVGDTTADFTVGGLLVAAGDSSLMVLYVAAASTPQHVAGMTAVATEDEMDEVAHLRSQLDLLAMEQDAKSQQLGAANEELMASNEEMQASNEELSSVNEELRALSDERQRRLDQVLDLTADMDQLLSGINVAVMFLDENLEVRRFSEPMTDYMRLRVADIGRPVADVRSMLDYDGLIDAVRRASIDGEPTVDPVSLADDPGRRLMLRVARYELPYARWGVFVMIADVTGLTRRERMITNLIDEAPVAIALWDEQNRLVVASEGFYSSSGSRLGELLGANEPAEVRRDLIRENARILETGEPATVVRDYNDVSYVVRKFRVLVDDGEPHVGGITFTPEQIRDLATGREPTEGGAGVVDASGDAVTDRIRELETELAALRSAQSRTPGPDVDLTDAPAARD